MLGFEPKQKKSITGHGWTPIHTDKRKACLNLSVGIRVHPWPNLSLRRWGSARFLGAFRITGRHQESRVSALQTRAQSGPVGNVTSASIQCAGKRTAEISNKYPRSITWTVASCMWLPESVRATSLHRQNCRLGLRTCRRGDGHRLRRCHSGRGDGERRGSTALRYGDGSRDTRHQDIAALQSDHLSA